MVLTLRMDPAASGRGLCDIDRILFRVTKLRVRKLGSPGKAKIYRLLLKSKNILVYFFHARTCEFSDT